MADKPQNDVRIAVLEEQIKGLREQQKAHADETRSALNGISHKIEALSETMNKGKGAFAVSILLAGIIGGAATKAIAAIWKVTG